MNLVHVQQLCIETCMYIGSQLVHCYLVDGIVFSTETTCIRISKMCISMVFMTIFCISMVFMTASLNVLLIIRYAAENVKLLCEQDYFEHKIAIISVSSWYFSLFSAEQQSTLFAAWYLAQNNNQFCVLLGILHRKAINSLNRLIFSTE